MAAKSILSLQEMCIARTGALLRDLYYHLHGGDSNPFVSVPSAIVNKLFKVVKQAEETTADVLRVDMLHPLLTSGRLTDLDTICDTFGNEDIIEIFGVIEPHASNVQRLRIGLVMPTQVYRNAMRKFIQKCLNVECLTVLSAMRIWDVNVALRLQKLKCLNIRVYHETNLTPNPANSTVVGSYSLTHLKLGGSLHDPPDLIAMFLTSCPNLISIDKNIANVLEMLHGEEYANGTLNTKYSLRKYTLFPLSFDLPSMDVAVHIAADTCPMTSDLNLYLRVNNFQEFDGLTRFKNMESLTINWMGREAFEFDRGFVDALQCIGTGIKKLGLMQMKVNFEAVGSLCPNLKSLRLVCSVENYRYSDDIGNPSADYFANLDELELRCSSLNQVKLQDLQFLLRNCKDLRRLKLFMAECLTDESLEEILARNSLKNLETVELYSCSLTQKGIKVLRETCHCLEKIDIVSTAVINGERLEKIKWEKNPGNREYNILRQLDSYPVYEELHARGKKRPFTD